MKKILSLIMALVLTASLVVGGIHLTKRYLPKAYNYVKNIFVDAKDYIDIKLENKDNNNYENNNEILLSYVLEKDSANGHGYIVDLYVRFENFNINSLSVGDTFVYKNESYVLYAYVNDNIAMFSMPYYSDFYNDIVENNYIKVVKG